eukprot:2083379-Prymnesium_polylepis.1
MAPWPRAARRGPAPVAAADPRRAAQARGLHGRAASRRVEPRADAVTRDAQRAPARRARHRPQPLHARREPLGARRGQRGADDAQHAV